MASFLQRFWAAILLRNKRTIDRFRALYRSPTRINGSISALFLAKFAEIAFLRTRVNRFQYDAGFANLAFALVAFFSYFGGAR